MSKLKFDKNQYEIRTVEVEGNSITFRAFENIIYVSKPIDTKFQVMNIYVPECYYQGKHVCGYSLHTAPILFENNIGGYLPSEPRRPEDEMFGRTSTFFYALMHGYVVATPGARGRTNRSAEGTFYGKAPAAIVDLKAALRYLRANADEIPGDADKIISCGTSAGGALSAVLGVSANQPEYEKYLKEIGAMDAEEKILGSCCYCPVTDLEHADMAYEWQFKGIYDFHRMHMEQGEGGRPQFTPVDGHMNELRIKLSDELSVQFITYLNSLDLRDENGKLLRLNENGKGSFRDYLTECIQKAAVEAKTKGKEISDTVGVKVYNGCFCVDFEKFMQEITRMKEAPAFDDVTMGNFENNLFGTETKDCGHFTNFSMVNSTCENPYRVDEIVVQMMNPLSYMKKNTAKAKHWRIRQGTKDRDIGFATPIIIALMLQNIGLDVDYKMVWDEKHGGDYDLPEFFAWIDKLCDEK